MVCDGDRRRGDVTMCWCCGCEDPRMLDGADTAAAPIAPIAPIAGIPESMVGAWITRCGTCLSAMVLENCAEFPCCCC